MQYRFAVNFGTLSIVPGGGFKLAPQLGISGQSICSDHDKGGADGHHHVGVVHCPPSILFFIHHTVHYIVSNFLDSGQSKESGRKILSKKC